MPHHPPPQHIPLSSAAFSATKASGDKRTRPKPEHDLQTVVRLLAQSAAREWFEADQLRQQNAQTGATSPGDRPP
ncbi:hypothetical protein ACTVH1_14645 [Gluconobacter cerinus]|nr:hypothetical protein GFGA_1d1506 [Gluconobacter frateurii NBRC 103465]